MHEMEVDTEIISDGKWISFIVGQVLDNSIKYAKEDEVLKLEVYLTNDNGKTVLNIQDNGIGMKTSECERAFVKGFTGSNGRKGKASTGIGLNLCKKLCNRLEHDISMESREGNGTKVSIRF